MHYTMGTENQNEKVISNEQSIKIIREMIEISKNKFRNDGILFIVWGWLIFTGNVIEFLQQNLVTTYQIINITDTLSLLLFIGGAVYTVLYIINQRKRVKTYIGVSIRYVWVSLILSMVLINLIQFNVLHEIKFELQHPIFMVVTAFAIVVTGGILRYNLLIIGGIIFAVLAYISSYLALDNQLLMEASGWLVAFVIPGHIMFSKRIKK